MNKQRPSITTAVTLPLARTALAALAACGAAAQASVITDPGDINSPVQVITFDGWSNLTTTGPVNVGAEIGLSVTFTSSPNARVGADQQALGFNGAWGNRTGVSTPTGSGNFVASQFVATRGEFGFTFSQAVSSVGAYFNQLQATASAANSLTFLAYDLDGNTLEVFNYRIETDPSSLNAGQFVGFKRSTADIYGFGIANGTFVMDNLTFTTPVPEPGTWALMAAGLGVLGAASLRRRRAD